MNAVLIDNFFTLLNLLVLCCGIGWIVVTKFIPSLRSSWQASHDAELKQREEEQRLTQEFALQSTKFEDKIRESERLKNIIIQMQHLRAVADQQKQQALQNQINDLKNRAEMRARLVTDSALQRAVFDKALAEASDTLRSIFEDSPHKVAEYDTALIAQMRSRV
jgi:hypothetical protein